MPTHADQDAESRHLPPSVVYPIGLCCPRVYRTAPRRRGRVLSSDQCFRTAADASQSLAKAIDEAPQAAASVCDYLLSAAGGSRTALLPLAASTLAALTRTPFEDRIGARQ